LAVFSPFYKKCNRGRKLFFVVKSVFSLLKRVEEFLLSRKVCVTPPMCPLYKFSNSGALFWESFYRRRGPQNPSSFIFGQDFDYRGVLKRPTFLGKIPPKCFSSLLGKFAPKSGFPFLGKSFLKNF